MLQKVTQHITTKFPFLKEKKLLIAVSGGIDSVVLSHLLLELNFNISLAHCNFTLRKNESDLDEVFVKNLAEKQNVNCFTTSFKTQKIASKNRESIQITARNLRYNWFQKLIEEHQFDYVLTAHHADDNLETFLINLTRGSGLEGFTGIPPMNKNIIRPLLPFSRTEILAYAKETKLAWREDLSNASTKYIRNNIRHNIIPILKKINPSLLKSFDKTLENLQESKQIIEDRITAISKDVLQKDNIISSEILKFDIKKIVALTNPKAYLYHLLKTYHFTEWNDVKNLLSAQSGKQLFSKTHVLLKDREFLILSEKEKLASKKNTFFIEEQQNTLENPVTLLLEVVNKITIENKNTIYVDKNLLKFPLQLKRWEEGSIFYPTGMQGKKKVSKFFKDEKLSLLEKQKTWLLCNNNNTIIWILGKRQDRRFLANTHSKNILRISLSVHISN